MVRAQLFNQQRGSKGFDIRDRASDILDGSMAILSPTDPKSKFMYEKADSTFMADARSVAVIKKTMNTLIAKMGVVGADNKKVDLTDAQVKDSFAGKPLVINGSTVQFKKELSFAMFHACANDEFALTKLSIDVTRTSGNTDTYSVEEPELLMPDTYSSSGVMKTTVGSIAGGIGMPLKERVAPVTNPTTTNPTTTTPTTPTTPVIPPKPTPAPTLPGAVPNPGAPGVIPNAPVIGI